MVRILRLGREGININTTVYDALKWVLQSGTL